MSSNKFSKKSFFHKTVIFRFVQKTSKDCASRTSVKTISILNLSKLHLTEITQELQKPLKVEYKQ